MRDPGTRAALDAVIDGADRRELQAMRRGFAAIGNRAALAYLDRAERRRRVVELARTGASASEIVEAVGCSLRTVRRELSAIGRDT